MILIFFNEFRDDDIINSKQLLLAILPQNHKNVGLCQMLLWLFLCKAFYVGCPNDGEWS